MSDFLTPAEIFAVTGKVQPAAQVRHLRRMGIKAERGDNPDNPVIVCKAWLAVKESAVVKSGKPKQRWEHGASA